MTSPPEGGADRFLQRLRSRRALARLAILFERAWPALWPPLGVLGLFVCLALLDLPRQLPPGLHIALLALFAIAFVTLLVRALRSLAAPDDLAADRRLERASGLHHRPLSVLTDRPAGGEPAQDPLWQAHLARAVRQVSRLRVGIPRPGLARRDRHAFRGALVVGLAAALVIAGTEAPSRLAAAVKPYLPPVASAPATQLQAWVTPPGYTGLAPQFLKSEGGSVSVPAGSHLTVNISGGPDAEPSLALNGPPEAFNRLDGTSFQAERDLTAGGRLAVRQQGRELAVWDLTVVADRAPTAVWAEPPGQAARSLQTRLPWQAADDYGVTGIQAELRLMARPDAAPITAGIPVPANKAKSAKGVNIQDLTSHPWAGLPVIARLVAKDAIGQQGESAAAEFVLPERAFQHPVARALIGIRKMLSERPEDRAFALSQLELLLGAPAPFAQDPGGYLNLSAIASLLLRDRRPPAIDEAQSRLWALALHMEEGQAERTARALEMARQAAKEALDRAVQEPNDPNRADLEKRLKELEEAIQRHMEALADQARREMSEMPFDQDAQRLSSRDMERLAEEAREAARQGRMNDAREKLAELERMLDQLKTARPERGRGDQQNAEKRQRGRQQMGALQDMIGREGGLLDRSQQRGSENQRPTRENNANQQAQRQGNQQGQQQGDQKVQQALRRALGELMQQFGDLTGQIPPSLGEADAAMREAGEALGQGRDQAAGAAQQRAIEALQKGGREMGQQMARQFGKGQPGQDGDQDGDQDGSAFSLQDGYGDRPGAPNGTLPGQRARGDRRDPLGRPMDKGAHGLENGEDTQVPGERERLRTQAIQEELRRRGADRTRPKDELDYIDRLLRQF